MDILFTSGLHGSIARARALAIYAHEIKPEAIIVAGSLAQSYAILDEKYIENQRRFLDELMPGAFGRIAAPVYMMQGGYDASVNEDVLERHHNINSLHGWKHNIRDLVIAGYPYSPADSQVRDYSKRDLESSPPPRGGSRSIIVDGKPLWVPYSVDEDSIQYDLERLAAADMYVFNALPGSAPGSLAIQALIERNKPRITLHSTDGQYGPYIGWLGDTVMLSVGNRQLGEGMAVLVFDPEKPEYARKEFI